MSKNQQPKIEWRGNVPVATRFDDPYFSLENGLAETRHVFLAGNDLPDRFAPGFQIAELGFGTGLNLFTTWKAWIDSGATGPLRFTSFEAFPMAKPDMAQALEAFPELAELSVEFLGKWPVEGKLVTDSLVFELVIGDARQTLPAWIGQADAWFLDGFAPTQNPELWGADLMQAVADHTVPGGSFATYTAAGHVRRALQDAGFLVERTPGFGRKRHMSRGSLA